MLEDWSSATLIYNGSMIVMFPNPYATNLWSYDHYYPAPIRNRAFDPNFANGGQAYLPPLTPETKSLIRQQWMAQ